jgi:Vps53-like, N-terminal
MAEAAHEQEALFDRDDFDAVDYVNQLFPTGAVQLRKLTPTPSLLCSPEERRVAWQPVRRGNGTDTPARVCLPGPAEAALVGVEPLIQKLKSKVHRVDADILAAVREQSSSGSQAREDLRTAMQAIEVRHPGSGRPLGTGGACRAPGGALAYPVTRAWACPYIA